MPYGTPSLDAPKMFQENSTSQESVSETSTVITESLSQQATDVVSQSSFIPLGEFSNRELFEVDAMRQRNRASGMKRKERSETWRVPFEDEVPWVTKDSGRKYKNATQRLHYEIDEVVKYLCPTDIERLWRVFAIKRIEQCIKSSYPSAEVMVFGSFNTGLYLPTSDLDIVCFVRDNSPNVLRKIANLLDYQRISAERPATIMKAVVPIIKFQEYYTKFNVDISFNQSSGYISARSMKEFLDQWPLLGKMVIVVKWFLKHHGLDDPSTGGMGGFTVFCMMLSFFQMHPFIRNGTLIPNDDNLGVLLIEFFELYGLKFNFFNIAIRVNRGGEYVLKNNESWTTKNPYTNICIQDPSDPDNDIARSTRNTDIIFSYFEKAFRRLVVRVGSLERKYHNQDEEMIIEESILSSIFFIPRRIIEFRKELHRLYADKQILADNYKTAYIIPPNFSHIVNRFLHEIEYADRLKNDKANKLSNRNGTQRIKNKRTGREYRDMAYQWKNEVDSYREYPCEGSTFLLATYGETYNKVFAYTNEEMEVMTKRNERKAGSSKSGRTSKDYERYDYQVGESSSSRGHKRHKVEENEIIYIEHDSEDDYYNNLPTQRSKRRKKGKKRN
ncbi:6891_t:CDS:2 [Funneliformis caledonium]|uniref:polynucleotide adenylyltransferase n=1 Tax=Funneliformis caledonium TaxID=1117310 RepID=A0A9N8ZI52_9GLOM|nr:6891_t:CDS:2 [Funneliformis caledonium]